MESKEPRTKQPNALATVGGLAGAAAGWGFSHYVGASIWVPALVSLVLFVLFIKTPVGPRHFQGAIAATGGHVGWFVVAALAASWEPVLLDVILLSVAVGLLWIKPSLATASVLGLIQLGSLAYNGYLITTVEVGTSGHKALSVHILFRLIALAALVIGVRRLKTATMPKVESDAQGDPAI